jgi:uncharacterized repeat protein (TIGR03803 family)
MKFKYILTVMLIVTVAYAGAQNAFVGVAYDGGTGGGTIFRFYANGTGYQRIRNLNDSEQFGNELIDIGDGYLYGISRHVDYWKSHNSIYRIKPDGSGYKVLKLFDDSNAQQYGSTSYGPLLWHQDRLYAGQNHRGPGVPDGGGTIISLDKNGENIQVLKSFVYGNTTEGYGPNRGLVAGPDGFLYGVNNTRWATSSTAGNIFKIRPDGSSFEVIHSFAIPAETGPAGSALNSLYPTGIVFGTDGFIYGCHYNYESQRGMVYRIKPDGSDFSILHQFDPSTEGFCTRTLVLTSSGDLYGTTFSKGAHDHGVIFKVSSGIYSVVFDFPAEWGAPMYGDLVQAGNYLWGSGTYGGEHGVGVIYKYNLTTGAAEKVLALTELEGYNISTLRPLTLDPLLLSVPTRLRMSPYETTHSSVHVYWNSVLDASAYRMDVSTDENFTSILPSYNNLQVADTMLDVTGLLPYTPYWIRVRAENEMRTSGNSDVLSVQTSSAIPTITSIIATDYNRVNVTWEEIPGASSVNYQMASDENFTSIVVQGTAYPAGQGISLSVPSPGTHYFRARSWSSVYSPYSTVAQVTAPLFGTPTFVKHFDVYPEGFKVSWTGMPLAVSYTLEVSIFPDFNELLPGFPQSIDTTVYAVTGLQYNTVYYYRVKATGNSGVSEYSGTNSVTTGLQAPVLLPVTGLSTTTATINWLAVPGATSYRIEVCRNSTSFSASLSQYLEVDGTQTSVSVTGLLPNSSSASYFYYYRVRSMTESVNSAYTMASNPLRTLFSDKAEQAVAFTSIPEKQVGDSPFDLAATASSGLSVTFQSSNTQIATVSGKKVTIKAAGSVVITAMQSGNTTWNVASNISQVLTIKPAQQTITFDPLPEKRTIDPPFQLTASSSSELAVWYTSSDPAVATVQGNMITITGAGTTTITAHQSGDAWGSYAAATDQSQALVIAPWICPDVPAVTVSQPTCEVPVGSISIAVQQADELYSVDGGNSFGAENTFSDLVPGLYQIAIQHASGCVSSMVETEISQPPQHPEKPTLTMLSADEAIAELISAEAYAYQWYKNGIPVDGAVQQHFMVYEDGSYSVVVFSAAGCASDASAPWIITGSESAPDAMMQHPFPNPAKHFLFMPGEFSTRIRYITNLQGKVWTVPHETQNGLIILDIRSLPAGLYVLHFQVEGASFVRRFVKQ